MTEGACVTYALQLFWYTHSPPVTTGDSSVHLRTQSRNGIVFEKKKDYHLHPQMLTMPERIFEYPVCRKAIAQWENEW